MTTRDRFQRYVTHYSNRIMTRAEMLGCFVDHIALAPGMVIDFYSDLPNEFDADLKQMAATPDDEWVGSFYPRGIGPTWDKSQSNSDFDPDAHALAILRAIQSLKIP